jgi:hypothetical protein
MRKTKAHTEVKVCKIIQIDDYNEGCLPNTFQDYGVIETFKVYSHNPETIVNEIKERYGKPLRFENRLEFNRQENAAGEELTVHELGAWREGKIKAYLADYSFYLTTVIETSWDQNQINEAFRHLLEEA